MGVVRVCPGNVQFVDVSVSGKIVESSGARLALQVTVKDSTGRVWVNSKQYASSADRGSHKTDAALKARDPFQNVYAEVANDMLTAREVLSVQNRRDVRRVTRLPAADDPISTRIGRIRERDFGVVDTVNGYYANFADQMSDSYGRWWRASFEEIEKVWLLRLQLPPARRRRANRGCDWRRRFDSVGIEEVFGRQDTCAGVEGADTERNRRGTIPRMAQSTAPDVCRRKWHRGRQGAADSLARHSAGRARSGALSIGLLEAEPIYD
jgi:hypothetical protein